MPSARKKPRERQKPQERRKPRDSRRARPSPGRTDKSSWCCLRPMPHIPDRPASIGEALKKAGYEYRQAFSGTEGLLRAETEQFDLAVMNSCFVKESLSPPISPQKPSGSRTRSFSTSFFPSGPRPADAFLSLTPILAISSSTSGIMSSRECEYVFGKCRKVW